MVGVGLAMVPPMSSARALPGSPTRVLPWCRSRPRQDACRGSRGSPRQGSRRGSSSSSPHLILCVYDLDEDLHAVKEVPPKPWFQCGLLVELETVGSRVACSVGVGQVAPARLLSGLQRLPRQGSCRGSPPRPLLSCVSCLGVALVVLCFGFSLASLLCPAKCGRDTWL